MISLPVGLQGLIQTGLLLFAKHISDAKRTFPHVKHSFLTTPELR